MMSAQPRITHRGPAPIDYFVAYAAQGMRIGMTQVQLALPVRSMEDVNVMAKTIEDEIGFPVVITNWRRFEATEPRTSGEPLGDRLD